ncbi:protein of unknown function [Candidatus Promineifilum breve]|uniref:Uncharacterized protein n=1 Tax=Candidatus Promineifilum breve TaxID=1806508 RepID=A0A160TAZ3_9CHLR|nr:protein of unknown function [Candidatus Promineifilum breve]
MGGMRRLVVRLVAIRNHYVSLRHLCEALGLARQGQVRRIRDDKILSEGYQGGNVLLPPSPGGQGDLPF